MNRGLFAEVDRALVVTALADRLRGAGLDVPLSATIRATAAIDTVGALSLDELYWLTRLSFVTDQRQLAVFDGVFDAVFDTDHRTRDRQPRRANVQGEARPGDEQHTVRLAVGDDDAVDGGGVPWATLPSIEADDGTDDDERPSLSMLERLAAADDLDPDKAFDLLDDAELLRVGRLVEASITRWPRRRGRRRRLSPAGDRSHHRAALRRAMRTGGEPLTIPRSAPVDRRRPVALFLDVSGSMESYAKAYLHIARPLSGIGRAEVFAFATDTTRITPSLRLRSPIEAIEAASGEVGDRFGGTRIATSLRTVLRHRVWASAVRGAVVVIVSDGWDTDPPEELDRHLARLHRLANRVVWVNPRAAADDFAPVVGGMAAALPHCDRFLPGHSISAMGDVLDAMLD